jgi:two-component system, NarL family, nitrate/nitrite response regulator NarL
MQGVREMELIRAASCKVCKQLKDSPNPPHGRAQLITIKPFLLPLLSHIMLIGHSRPIQVHLVAEALVCWGLERLVQTGRPGLEVAGMASSLAESLPLLQRYPADVVVIDLDGEDVCESLVELHAQTHARVLVVTGSADMAVLDRVVLAGVRGIVKKRESPSTLLKAIEKVHDGELWIDRGATSRIFMEMARQKASEKNDPEKSKIATLTMRERQTIIALASDASAPGKVIAQRLCISEHTLRNHLTSIYSKLGLSNRLDLYAYASKHSLNKAA